MFSRGKLITAAFGAVSLSGALAVPATNLFAAPAPEAPVAAAALQFPTPVLPPMAPIPNPVEADATEAPQPATNEPAETDSARAEVNERELDCMTRVMLYEAGNEGQAGQLAVGHVVLNRVRSPRFPDSVCSVVYQRGQFSSIRSFNHPRNARWQRAQALARNVLAGETQSNVGTALYFHATRVRPAYVQNRVRVGTVGNHVFYR